ncbi:DUF3822 family protein [Sunxiuqinia sp. A32]|uniref:DUF3822 family protein n=1 Tax=Sunxiuqinia sp. A32 TaxID=3461496 RepID=UPI0040466CE3
MQKLSLVDETFDLNFISEYHLSIQLSLDGLSFCILDGIQKKYVSLVHHPILSNTPELSVKRLKEIFKEEDFLKPYYKSTRIIYSSQNSTMVPPPYINDSQKKQILEINFGKTKNEKILETTLSPYYDVLLYGIPNSLSNFLEEKYSDIPIEHECRPFLWSILNQGNPSDQLAVLIHEKYCWIIYLNDNKLKFINSFAVQNDDDVLFYALNVATELNIDPEVTPIMMDGLCSKKSAIYHRFRQYIKHIKLVDASKDLQYSYLFNQLPDSRFNCLLNSYPCEL